MTNVSNHHCRIYCKINYALAGELSSSSSSSSSSSTRDDNQNLELKKTSSMHVYDLLVEYLSCLEVWVEDLSTNGTFVNGSAMPKKGSRLLHHGDTISLINPEIDPKTIILNKGLAKADIPSAVKLVQEEILSNSFDIMIFLPSSQPKKTKAGISGIAMQSLHPTLSHELTISHSQMNNQTISSCNTAIGNHIDSLGYEEHSDLRKSTTVFRLLHQERNFHDHYHTGRQIGFGGAAKVYEATHKDTGIKYAVKVMDYRHYVSTRVSVASAIASHGPEAAMYSILKEAELLRSLRHPSIIHLDDIFADDRYLYLVMELLRGGDLFDRLAKKQQYAEADAKRLMQQALAAIDYLHRNKVAHRDIKLENILLTSPSNDVDIKLTGK
jgi:pSer/pThr/pTyr-binding forkhead associated (FHA) protein/tRNA A-37 threonylcarbamoyl transferase component Bud32